MDVGYVFRHSEFDDLELRYSLRSVAKHLPWIRKVFVFGDRPEFLSDDRLVIEHVPWEAVAWVGGVRVPVVNLCWQYCLLALWPELDSEFLIFHDDHILLGDVSAEVARRNRYVENLAECRERGTGKWKAQLWRTFDWLQQAGLPTYNFESLTPRHTTKRRLFAAFAALRGAMSEERFGGLLGPTAILNRALNRENFAITRRDEENLTQGFTSAPARHDELVEKTQGKRFLYFNEKGFSADLRQFLAERFPEPCVYEAASHHTPLPKYDVVYLLAKSKWNQELKYSLRSFERFFPQLGTVWIVGYLPEYIDPATVRHVPEPTLFRPGVFVESAAVRVLNDQLEGLTEDYILAQDDNYLLRPVTLDEFGPFAVENLDDVKVRSHNPWQSMLWRTYDLLKFQGYSGHNYECHTPIRLTRSKFREVAARFIHTEQAAQHRYHGVCLRTAYVNILADASRPAGLAADYRVGFTKAADAITAELIQAQLHGRRFLFHDDQGLTEAMKSVLAERYPVKSQFEFESRSDSTTLVASHPRRTLSATSAFR
jgi:hypothetical protein